MALEYPTYADKAIFVDLLASGESDTEPANQTYLDAWIEGGDVPFTTVADAPGVGPRILKDFSPKENTYLVELETLTIVEHTKAPSTLYPVLDGL